MKHTPGPWKWHHRSEDQSHNGSVFSEMRTGMAYAVAMMPRYQKKEQWEADAHLIAAAPDLLRELETLFVRSGVLMILEDDDRERIESVIKKAKGETS